nr:AT hook domain-containing protein [Colletotrichum truncatum]KAF6798326.1 AT hook domain-containing protein [Colletotrichum truncatum]
MTTRAERMQQRMRGAGHGQIEDVSFQLDFGDDLTTEIEPQDSPEEPPPRTTPTPNTSAKRRKLDSDSTRPLVSSQGGDQARRSLDKPGSIEPQDGPARLSLQPAAAEQPTTSPTPIAEEPAPDSAEALPPPRPPAPAPPISPVTGRVTSDYTEVEESPADAPGSGRRRTITSSALGSSARLQQALSPEDNETEAVPISSPLERKARRTTASTRRSTISSRGSRSSGIPGDVDIDGRSLDGAGKSVDRTVSPELSSRRDTRSAEPTTHSDEPVSEPEPELEPESLVEEDQVQSHGQDESLAEEVDIDEAAQRLGRKRPRRSPRGPSAEPDSIITDEDQEAPLAKKRRKQLKTSPAKQKQGRPKAASKAKNSPPKTAPKRRKKKSSDATGDDETVSIPVQRFTKRVQAAEGEDGNADVLSLDIPFANRGGVNTVDVLTQMCDEIVGTSLDTLKEGVRNAEDAPTKKEFRVQVRALEAFQEELRNRLLQHTILLDTLHSLRKRLRSVQKERITLRDEIMQIRAERDQVALRKDAVRAKHDKVKEEALVSLPVERPKSAL